MRRLAGLLLLAAALLPAQPRPESYFGHKPGADRTLIPWSKVVGWFNELDQASDRVVVREYGKSTEGRPMIAAFLSSPQNLGRLEALRQIQKRLADPRATQAEDAEKLFAEGKAIVLITCSIHSTEVASTFSAIEFAYRLATADDPKTRQILDNVIVILAPSINPDGVDIVHDWYQSTLGTPFEGTTPPELYQKYVGHDNNRDWYIFSQAETRAVVSALHNQWHPQIVYDVHQMGSFAARMFVPPWLDPIEPNVDPVIAQQSNMIGMTAAADLTAAGRKGVVVQAVYDFWTPARAYQSFHGGMRILSESASPRLATPVTVRPDQISSLAQGYNPRERSWNHLEPWTGGEWRVADIMEDQLIAMESVCWQAAVRREFFLRSFYGILKRASERQSPFAFRIPARQADPDSAKKLLETLAFGAVEIERTSEGDYLVRMQQPFSSFAKALLEKQVYPDLRLYPGGPPKRPYDVTAHTLPLLMGVDVQTVESPVEIASSRTTDFRFTGLAPGLPASDNASWRAINRAWKDGVSVARNPRDGSFQLKTVPPGWVKLEQPRLGLYRSGPPQMDEGWTRWILEQYGWDYTSVRAADVRAGSLKSKYDVLLFVDQSAASLHSGYRTGQMPDSQVGGLGPEGAASLKQFLAEGGRLIFLNESGEYAVEQLGIKAKNALKGVSNRDYYCPGSLLTVKKDANIPGLPSEFTIWHEGSPVWEPEEGNGGRVLLRYAAQNVLASGWLLGEKFLAGKPALVELPAGKGKVTLFGMRPQYRAQSLLTLKLLFQALLPM